jgi:hypothetical protein
LRGSCKTAPHYNMSATKGGLQLAATTRATREGPQHGDPQGGGSGGGQRGNERRPGRRPPWNAGGSRGGDRYTKRGAEGGRCRKRAAVTGGRCRKRAAVMAGLDMITPWGPWDIFRPPIGPFREWPQNPRRGPFSVIFGSCSGLMSPNCL